MAQHELPLAEHDELLFSGQVRRYDMNTLPRIVPGLLQTPSYTEATLAGLADLGFAPELLQTPEEVYDRRQQRLAHLIGRGIETTVYLDEEALTWPDPNIHPDILLETAGKIRGLIGAKHRGLTIGVLPSRSDRTRAAGARMPGSYIVMELEDGTTTHMSGEETRPTTDPTVIGSIAIAQLTFGRYTLQNEEALPLILAAEEELRAA